MMEKFKVINGVIVPESLEYDVDMGQFYLAHEVDERIAFLESTRVSDELLDDLMEASRGGVDSGYYNFPEVLDEAWAVRDKRKEHDDEND